MNIWDLGTFQRLKRLTTVYSEITFPNEANRHPNCRMFSRKEKKYCKTARNETSNAYWCSCYLQEMRIIEMIFRILENRILGG